MSKYLNFTFYIIYYHKKARRLLLPHSGNMNRKDIARVIVENLIGEDSVAISNPEKALGIIMRLGMRNDASTKERVIAVKVFNALLHHLGRDTVTEILRRK